ncbi:uncharacterized protein BX664DRAFT_282580 [Halteromyces radiatus]|uniref:uncharacterized protein n=1 Tax=Halteromyces radiatus TaxID=101107 RepID=UPI00221F6E1D|nr:uncharacterized protein BX664DRAFT_282580 [Halteromyces radiatus]KAI8086548.1 hypothetical protein BX664DRAFT_282580 [Halteromyces radiatus]
MEWLEVYNHQFKNSFYVNQETGEWSKDRLPNTLITKARSDTVWFIQNMNCYYHSKTNQWSHHPPSSSYPVILLSNRFAMDPSHKTDVSLPISSHPLSLETNERQQSNLKTKYHQHTSSSTHTNKPFAPSSLVINNVTNHHSDPPMAKKQGSLLQLSKSSIEATFKSKIFPQVRKRFYRSSSSIWHPPSATCLDVKKEEGTTLMHPCPCHSPKHQTLEITSSPIISTSTTNDNHNSSCQTYSFEEYAANHFTIHKRGFLIRTPIPLSEMISWTKSSIYKPLLVSPNRKHSKNAIHCFKLIQMIMGDRPRQQTNLSSNNNDNDDDDVQDIQAILRYGLTQGQQMRDEIYAQLCKQLDQNPRSSSCQKGWELLSVLCSTFPPSKTLAFYLIPFVQHHLTEKEDMDTTLSFCTSYLLLKIKRICQQGAREKVISRAEIQLARMAVSLPSEQQQQSSSCFMFGRSLTMIMKQQQQSLKIPLIVPFLVEAISKLHGHSAQGIFRVPGLTDLVTALRVRIESGYYDDDDDLKTLCGGDPAVPASLLRQWLRELPTPLIPMSFYDQCIDGASDIDTVMDIVGRLPDVNRRVLLYIIGFLQEFLAPDVRKNTLMTVNNLAMVFAPNFLRCPLTDDLNLALQQSKHEQRFVQTLLLGSKVDMDRQLYN